jgi:hypothetical protein
MMDDGNDERKYEYTSVKTEGASVGEDVGKCCSFCCRMPITSLAIIGGTFFAISYFPNHPDPMMRLGGTGLTILVLALIIGFFYYRYRQKEVIVHRFEPGTQL